MNPSNHAVRWIAAGVTVLALAGAGTVTATTEPPDDTTAGTEDTAMTETSAATGEGAGPSDCPAITGEVAGSEAPAESEAAEGTMAEGTAAADTAAEATMAEGTTAADTAAEGTAAEGTTAADTAAEGTAAEGTAAEGTAAEGSAAPMTGPFVQIVETDEYGPILVDGACFTLYGFTPDGDAGGEPTCVDDCAAAWPPLLVTDESVPPLADELDPSLFSVVEHASGPMLKVGDWPLYLFAEDTEAGDINGQGVGGFWWVVAPDGTLIETEEGGAEDTAEGSEAPAGSEPSDTATETTVG